MKIDAYRPFLLVLKGRHLLHLMVAHENFREKHWLIPSKGCLLMS